MVAPGQGVASSPSRTLLPQDTSPRFLAQTHPCVLFSISTPGRLPSQLLLTLPSVVRTAQGLPFYRPNFKSQLTSSVIWGKLLNLALFIFPVT